MASRILNRRELRKQSDEAEQTVGAPTEGADAAAPPRRAVRAKKTSAKPAVRKVRAKKAPPRMCARWGVFDGGMKQIAIFDYNQRAAADDKLAHLNATKKGPHFLQIVKEPMAEADPIEVTAAK